MTASRQYSPALSPQAKTDASSIARRKAFLQFDDRDIDRLRHLHTLLRDSDKQFVQHFYDHLLQFPETRALLPDAATLERLKQSQAVYFDSLTAGDYGEDYVRHRLQVGIAHQRVGLAPAWYLGAYANYLGGLLPEIWQRLDGDRAGFLDAVQSLIKVVLFDMGLAIDTYIDAGEQALSAVREYAELVFAQTPSGLLVLSDSLEVLSANTAFLAQIQGQTAEVVGHDLFDILTLHQGRGYLDQPALARELASVLGNGGVRRDLYCRISAPGDCDSKPVNLTLAAIRNKDDNARLLITVEDFTEQERQELALRDSQAMLNRAQSVAGIGSWSMDIARQQLDWSDETFRICGMSPDAGITQERFLALVHPADRLAVYSAWQGALLGKSYNIDHRIVVGGETRWINARAEMEFDPDDRPVRAVGTIHDITERKRSDAKIQHLAFYDSLTSLPNRALCLDRLKQSIRQCERHHQQLAVLFIDLDLFKHVNDSLGHDAGDRLLQTVAERLSLSVRKADTVARLGGDEFVVLLQDVDEDAAQRVTDKLLQAFHRPFQVDKQSLHISCSIGMALYPRDGRDTRTLLRNADAAMYRAKSSGRNNAQFYTEDLNRRALERLQLQEDMHDALQNRDFRLHYQPRIDLASGQVTALEALIRWEHPTRGELPPDVFIPIAEESGLITALGECITREACHFAVKLKKTLGRPVKIAVNLSARQFWQPDLAMRIANILSDTGLAGEYLEIELTESMIMHQVDQAIHTMHQLKGLGVSLAIDDFGTGFSSLSHLKRFPVSILKIDKSFVAGVPHHPDDLAIVSSTISLAHNMGLKVVAEGVETEAQRIFLHEQGCDELQGYLFARPMPAKELIPLLQTYREMPSGQHFVSPVPQGRNNGSVPL